MAGGKGTRIASSEERCAQAYDRDLQETNSGVAD